VLKPNLRRRTLVGSVLTVTLGAVLAFGASSGPAVGANSGTVPIQLAASTTSEPAGLPADCQPSVSAPPYELGTVIQIGHPPGGDPTLADGTLTAGPISVAGIAGSLCGIATIVPGTDGCAAQARITIPADGQHFVPLDAVLSVNPAEPATVPFAVIPLTITASLGCGSSASGLAVSSATALEGDTGLFGIGCVIGPSQATLTGNFNSPDQSFSDFTGTLAGPIGLAPAAVAHACPSEIASNLNSLAGLPRTGQLTLPTKVALYLPGTAP
jgi:hypothetical protein